MEADKIRQIVRETTAMAYSLASRDQSPLGRRTYSRLSTPLPGDFVAELTTLWSPAPGGIGYFLSRVYDLDHPDGPDQKWDYWLWKIDEQGSIGVRNWANCLWIVVPTRRIRLEIEKATEPLPWISRARRYMDLTMRCEGR